MNLERTYRTHMYFQRFWRIGRRCYLAHVPLLPGLVRGFSRIVFQADVPTRVDVPRGVVFMHNGLGLVVHTKVKFRGPAIIFHHVTLGNSKGLVDGEPSIGSRVMIGAGACILGPIRVGDNVIIGANAVVARDIPDGSLVTGNPATVRPVDPAVLDNLFGPKPVGSPITPV